MQLAALLGSIYAEVAAVQRKDRFNTVSIRKMHERHVGQLKMLIDIAFHNLCHRDSHQFHSEPQRGESLPQWIESVAEQGRDAVAADRRLQSERAKL